MLGVCLIAAPASAELIEFTFTGEIDLVVGEAPAPWADVQIGTPWTMRYVFDSEEPDQATSIERGFYDLISAEIEIDGASQTTDQGWIQIRLNENYYSATMIDFPFGGGAGISLYGPPSAFPDDSLPPDLDLDDYYPFAQYFEVVGLTFEFEGDVLDFSSAVIPAPTVMPLMMFGMFLARRRRH
jgi:hypothetical protein